MQEEIFSTYLPALVGEWRFNVRYRSYWRRREEPNLAPQWEAFKAYELLSFRFPPTEG
jgi:hypothetical protein